MGTNHPGEIRRLSAMAQPTICLITNVGVAHIEFFGTRENIFRGKAEMLEHMRPGGAVIVNGDDDMLVRLPGAVRFGFQEHNDVRACEVEDLGLSGSAFTVCAGGGAGAHAGARARPAYDRQRPGGRRGRAGARHAA